MIKLDGPAQEARMEKPETLMDLTGIILTRCMETYGNVLRARATLYGDIDIGFLDNRPDIPETVEGRLQMIGQITQETSAHSWQLVEKI